MLSAVLFSLTCFCAPVRAQVRSVPVQATVLGAAGLAGAAAALPFRAPVQSLSPATPLDLPALPSLRQGSWEALSIVARPSALPSIPAAAPGLVEASVPLPAAHARPQAGAPSEEAARPAVPETARAALEGAVESLEPALRGEASEGKAVSDRVFDLTPRAQAVVDAARDAGVPVEHFVQVEGIPPFLTVADADDRAWLAKTLGAAARTRIGRSVLRRAAAVAARRGRPIPVQVEELRSENGSFVYDWEVLQLARSLVRDDAPEAAAIIVHELLHFVQRDIGLPSDALEMELEAHIVTLQVFRGLGAKVPKTSFSYGFEQALLRGGAPGVIEWLAGQYGENIGILDGGSVEDYLAKLEKRRKLRMKSIAKAEKLLARRLAVLEDLRAAGHPAKTLENYESDQVAPLREKMRTERITLEWVERDLALLRDPAGAERYRAFAQRVLKRIERYHRLIAG